jgi:hypothetical protein
MIVSFCRIFLSFAVNDRWGNDTTGVHGSFFVSFSLCLYVLYVVARALSPLSLFVFCICAHKFPASAEAQDCRIQFGILAHAPLGREQRYVSSWDWLPALVPDGLRCRHRRVFVRTKSPVHRLQLLHFGAAHPPPRPHRTNISLYPVMPSTEWMFVSRVLRSPITLLRAHTLSFLQSIGSPETFPRSPTEATSSSTLAPRRTAPSTGTDISVLPCFSRVCPHVCED